VEKMEFGMAPRRCKIHSKPQPLLQKTCFFYFFIFFNFWNLNWIRSSVPAYAYFGSRTHALAHVRRLLPMYVGRGPV